MQTLDLHGVRHADVERLVENAVLLAKEDITIITGNSAEMQKIVLAVLNKHICNYLQPAYNLGEIIVII